jgi:hypothetical protein
MAAVDMRADLSILIDSVISGDIKKIVAAAREYLRQDKAADVLIGRIGMIAAHGDTDGHPTLTLNAASMIARLAYWIPAPFDTNTLPKERNLPLFVQALKAATTCIQKGYTDYTTPHYPDPFFPSELIHTNKTVSDVMRTAIATNDATLAERILLGLYGTGADYRTMQVRTYESISHTFHYEGHPFIFSVRGFQLLDAVEWGNRAPHIIHWLAPFLPLPITNSEPSWIKTVRTFAAQHNLGIIRNRLAAAKNDNALPLHEILLSDTDTIHVCQEIYDALVTNGASTKAVAAVISLAAAHILQRVSVDDHARFITVAHGLLFSAALQTLFQQVQDVDVLNLLYVAASAINALHKETPATTATKQAPTDQSTHVPGGGLMALPLLDTLKTQITAQDLTSATNTAQRYLSLGHDPRALFGTIGLAAALVDTTTNQGHTLQIVQAANDALLYWPSSLTNTDTIAFVQLALCATIAGQRDPIVAALVS